MTQEDKELLLKDLCERLPYGVIVNVKGFDFEFKDKLTQIYKGYGCSIQVTNNMPYGIEQVKPYLFPISSMSKEQKREYDSIIYHEVELHCERYYNVIDVDCYEELHDFYHKYHLDYRNLIGKGLALDATGLNIY